MNVNRHDDLLYGTFDAGRDLREAYHDLMREHDVEAGIIQKGIGMLEDPTLGYFEGDGVYDRETVEGAFELLTTQGNLSMADGDPFAHVHVTLGGPDHDVVGGHLFTGEIAVVHELAVRVVPDGSLVREHDPETGLKGLQVR